ncbi:MaoC/PaaZ C-terminal domain-containing protein [Sphingobacterium sp.]|uniref:MaoC family dehydratase n=1 Tax=Sphingobacterium sp. TaxID=341027 RepID=UPI0028ABB0D0|nr:MaoC/PaaZ C-terminal domain-containing protein [Sphingobacterium sp.]
MIHNQYFEEYILNEVRESLGRTITEADIVIHAGQTGDFFPHHMDAEWCKSQSFGQRIAHGTLIFSISIGMTANIINEHAFSYGYERLRFIKPVFIGDTINVKLYVKEKRPYKDPNKGMIVESIEVWNQMREIVMVCDHLLIVSREN